MGVGVLDEIKAISAQLCWNWLAFAELGKGGSNCKISNKRQQTVQFQFAFPLDGTIVQPSLSNRNTIYTVQ